MKHVIILGSTGSIGKSALDVIRRFPKDFSISGLSTNSDIGSLYQQIKEFSPKSVCVRDRAASQRLKSKLRRGIKLFVADDGLGEMVKEKGVDKILLAISGSGALMPLLAAIEENKEIALANKEALVMAGPLIMRRARIKKAKIMPIDSEQSAIWQCLNGERQERLKNIYLTASGGPLWQSRDKSFENISVDRVLKHPRWKMGKKITVDSATLMNKGLEVLEAMFLFGVSIDKIKVLIHPEAIIHSMVEFIDGVTLAQLSITDMRIPIQYALSYPERLPTKLKGIDFSKLKGLHFQSPDFKRFPSLALAYRAAKEKGTVPCVLNAANEVSVEAFLKRKISFIAIPQIIEKVINRHKNIKTPGLNDILAADNWARQEARNFILKRF